MGKKMIEEVVTTKVRALPKEIGSVLLFVSNAGFGTHVYGALVRTGMDGWIQTQKSGYTNDNAVRKLIETNTNAGEFWGEGYWIEPDEQEATYA